MATTFYITAGLPAQDNNSARTANTFYITAGLPANDLPVVTSGSGTKRGRWLLYMLKRRQSNVGHH